MRFESNSSGLLRTAVRNGLRMVPIALAAEDAPRQIRYKADGRFTVSGFVLILLRMIPLCCFGLIGANADTVGVLQWTGDPTIDYCAGVWGSCQDLILPSDATGISALVSNQAFGQFDGISYVMYRPFTVTSAGGFEITSAASLEGFGEMCGPTGICSNLNVSLDGNWGGVGIQGAGISSKAVEFPDPNPYGALSENVAPAWFPLTAADGSTSIITLDVGTYALYQTVDAYVLASNDPTMTFAFTTDILGVDPPAAVPEPNALWASIVLIGVMVGVVCVLRSRDARYHCPER